MNTNNNAANNGNNNVNNAITAKTLKEIRKNIADYVDSFKNACRILLEVADSNKELKRLNAYLGLTTEAIKAKNIGETRKNILDKMPYYYTIEGSETHFPARLRKVDANMKEAGMNNGFIAVKDTYLNALLYLGKLISENNSYTQHELSITDTAAKEINDMNDDNTTCTIYNKEGEKIADNTAQYIKYKQAMKEAANSAKAVKAKYYTEALG